MDESVEKCPVCFKPAKPSSKGSITQWIAVCRCGLEPTVIEEAESVNTCLKCKKTIRSSRPGSFTQWIFGPHTCSCDFPLASIPVPAAEVELVDFSELDDRSYMEIDSDEFPIDRYRPIREIGSGSMNTVYLCFDALLRKEVAVKIMKAIDPALLVNFQREAKVTSRINHENIAKVYDFGVTAGGVAFLVMEYIPGISLTRYLEEHGAMPVERALRFFLLMLDALRAAHRNNVFHRDLKPDNILVVEPLVPKIIDFGLAREQTDQIPNALDGQKVVGTPAYMSPDQLKTGQYDARSEIYSVGCILFELLTAQQVFSGENAMELIFKHASETPPTVSSLIPANSQIRRLDSIVARCLQKDPAARFQSVDDLIRELHSVPEQSMTESYILKPEKKKFPATQAALVAGFLVLFLAGLYYSSTFMKNRTTEQTKTPEKVAKKIKKEKIDTRQFDQVELEPALNFGGSGHDGAIVFMGANAANQMRHALEARKGEKIEIIVMYDSNLTDADVVSTVKINPYCFCSSGSPKLTDRTLTHLSKAASHLDRLELEDSPGFTPAGLAKLQQLNNLGYISLRNCNLSDEHLKPLAKIRTLFKLNLSNNPKLTSRGLEELARTPRIKPLELVIDECPNIFLSASLTERLAQSKIKLQTTDEGSVDPTKLVKELVDDTEE